MRYFKYYVILKFWRLFIALNPLFLLRFGSVRCGIYWTSIGIKYRPILACFPWTVHVCEHLCSNVPLKYVF